MDGAPFIGWSLSTQKDAYLVATGFNAWGITNGTVAGMIIADLAQGQKSQWSTLFDATRIKPIASAPLFVKENLGIAKHLVGGYLNGKPESFARLAKGEAAVLRINGKDVAAFRDEAGKVHAISAACTHMGCLLGWNATDRTWDCHCHGSTITVSGSANCAKP
ncbi:Rieske 2Fe-2S domain-containing protein [Methyloceanibacter sp.]|uniref:Rieske 2Fe-2S domain-containing protein n=1 Tax=Methyloceanibacter sp. TaxID=1965321 RepID=UPI002CF6344B|nr:Rieske 2Fe-2S domain-containing protein [Methyloceanibacter sp.]HML93029.1 Rieske 2Fe-2S domain-containing protein [Methyloceanibacter sp.]